MRDLGEYDFYHISRCVRVASLETDTKISDVLDVLSIDYQDIRDHYNVMFESMIKKRKKTDKNIGYFMTIPYIWEDGNRCYLIPEEFPVYNKNGEEIEYNKDSEDQTWLYPPQELGKAKNFFKVAVGSKARCLNSFGNNLRYLGFPVKFLRWERCIIPDKLFESFTLEEGIYFVEDYPRRYDQISSDILKEPIARDYSIMPFQELKEGLANLYYFSSLGVEEEEEFVELGKKLSGKAKKAWEKAKEEEGGGSGWEESWEEGWKEHRKEVKKAKKIEKLSSREKAELKSASIEAVDNQLRKNMPKTYAEYESHFKTFLLYGLGWFSKERKELYKHSKKTKHKITYEEDLELQYGRGFEPGLLTDYIQEQIKETGEKKSTVRAKIIEDANDYIDENSDVIGEMEEFLLNKINDELDDLFFTVYFSKEWTPEMEEEMRKEVAEWIEEVEESEEEEFEESESEDEDFEDIESEESSEEDFEEEESEDIGGGFFDPETESEEPIVYDISSLVRRK